MENKDIKPDSGVNRDDWRERMAEVLRKSVAKFLAVSVSATLAFIISSVTVAQSQQQTVELEIINEDGSVKDYTVEWPYNGPPPTGGNTEVIKKVDKILSENDINCPPQRVKVSDNIWKCGNGKKIRAKDAKLSRLLSKAWDN
jgi:hypothetical protein